MSEGRKSGGNTPREKRKTEHTVAGAFQSASPNVEALTQKIGSASIEGSEGQSDNNENLFTDQSWNDAKDDLTMKDTVMASKQHFVPGHWIDDTGTDKKKLNLNRIYADLPKFLQEMKTLKANADASRLPRESNDQPVKFDKDKPFKALSLVPPCSPPRPRYYYLDSPPMLRIHLPDSSELFDSENRGNWLQIQKIKCEQKEKRWVFTPSYRRAKIALLNWPEEDDDEVCSQNTHRILVVRPSEFDEYVKYCGHLFPVVSLPSNESGAGYARFWIQKIALRLGLEFIWMIDDSCECFYKYRFQENRQTGKFRNIYTPLKFGEVFKRIEELVREKQSETPIAAMSPTRYRPRKKLVNSFKCKPPQGAVYLNLKALFSKHVFYRPELLVAEDMVFGYECEQNGLKVFVNQHFHLLDKDWKDSGARSSSSKKVLKLHTS